MITCLKEQNLINIGYGDICLKEQNLINIGYGHMSEGAEPNQHRLW